MHTTSTCIVHCMDFRIQGTIDKLLASLKADSFDRVSVAGGAGNFEQLEKHLELSEKLHHPSRFILTVHEDCGAGAKKEDLRKAAEYAAVFPHVATRLFYVKLDGTWEEV